MVAKNPTYCTRPTITAEAAPLQEVSRIHQQALHSLITLCRVPTMGADDRNVRMSLQTLKVLEAFLADPTLALSGADVHQQSGIASGTLYPILLRLESAGWFVSRWESVDPSAVGRDPEADSQTPMNSIRRSRNGSSNRGSRRFMFVWMRMGG